MIFPGVERASSEQSGKKNVENVESSERASEASRGELETFSTFFFPALRTRYALETKGKPTWLEQPIRLTLPPWGRAISKFI